MTVCRTALPRSLKGLVTGPRTSPIICMEAQAVELQTTSRYDNQQQRSAHCTLHAMHGVLGSHHWTPRMQPIAVRCYSWKLERSVAVLSMLSGAGRSVQAESSVARCDAHVSVAGYVAQDVLQLNRGKCHRTGHSSRGQHVNQAALRPREAGTGWACLTGQEVWQISAVKSVTLTLSLRSLVRPATSAGSAHTPWPAHAHHECCGEQSSMHTSSAGSQPSPSACSVVLAPAPICLVSTQLT